MFTRLKWRIGRSRIARASQGILQTPPARLGPVPATLVSMVQTADVQPYLVSVKSFLRQLPMNRVLVIDDGSLTPADRALIAAHVPGITITPIASIDTGACQRGGCWERLLHILDLSAAEYVVQLDADIVTTGPVPEVSAAIAENRCFTLGSSSRYGIVTTAEAAAEMDGEDPGPFQVAAELALAHVPAEVGRFYVRGSAGFAGFAKGAVTRATAEAFSRAMEARMGKRWLEWGSEQVASNFLTASAPGGMVLPWPRYRNFYGTDDVAESALIHFIGSWRFEKGVYARLCRQAVADLMTDARSA